MFAAIVLVGAGSFAAGRLTAPGSGFFSLRAAGTPAPDALALATDTTPSPVLDATDAVDPVGNGADVPMPAAGESGETPAPTPETTPEPTPEPAAAATETASARASTPKPAQTPRLAAARTPTLEQARTLLDAGKLDAGVALLEDRLRAVPSDTDARYLLASSYRAQRKPARACREWTNYLSRAAAGERSDAARRHQSVCDAKRKADAGDVDGALADLQAFVRANWTFADGHYYLATLQAKKGDAAACASFKSYLRLDPKGPHRPAAESALTKNGC